MRISLRSLFILVAIAVAAVAPRSVHAQYLRYGFLGVGIGGAPDEAYLDPQFTLSGGFQARWGPLVGINIGIRTITSYARLKPDTGALLDSLGVQSGDVEGGQATVHDTGIDGLVSYDTGVLGGYGWYGIHYYNESRSDAEITTPGGTIRTQTRNRSDLGPNYGVGLNLHISRRASVFAEWAIGGGFDDRMIRQEGVRAGIIGVF
ncbi:MAG TPA: hypothetical protein VFS20_09405 [Longimicrobium sp.]|nr:hypothetical protein [Longimicrobium sp.]